VIRKAILDEPLDEDLVWSFVATECSVATKTQKASATMVATALKGFLAVVIASARARQDLVSLA
jgi:hypothetical protein